MPSPDRAPRTPVLVSNYALVGALVGLAALTGCSKASSGHHGYTHAELTAQPDAVARAQPASEADQAAKIAEERPVEDAQNPDEDEDRAAPDEALKLACDDQRQSRLYLSPDDSNSMSSPVQVRARVLGEGSTHIADLAIRPWEFMNFYSFDYAPAPARELALYTSMRPVAEADPAHPRFDLQIAVASEAMTPEQRPPMNVTFVLDSSGSMSGKSIELLREASLEIAGQLRAGDTASVVEWDTKNTWSLANHKISGPRDRRLARVLRRIRANGGTDLHGGLSSGYALARRTWDPQAINRLVLISDGGANVGVLDTDLIAENATLGGEDGIYLVGVGVGDALSYHDLLMDAVTDAGKGASVFLSSDEDIDELFDARFLETMAVAARDVRVELTMPPGFEIVRFSGEEYSTVAEEIEPQHLAPNDVMVFHQEIETCAPKLLEPGAGEAAPQVHVRLTWHDRDDHELQAIERDYDFAELLAEPDPHLLEGAAVFAYAEGLQAYQRSGDPRDLAPAYAELQAAQRALPGDPDLAEIEAILVALMGDQLQ